MLCYDKIKVRGTYGVGDSLTVFLGKDNLNDSKLIRKIEEKITAMTPLYDDFVVVVLQDKNGLVDKNFPTVFQTINNRSFGLTDYYRVEVGFKTDTCNTLYRIDCLSLEETLRLFRSICVDRIAPCVTDWEGPEIFPEEKDEFRDKCLHFISKLWQDGIGGEAIKSVELEALEYLAYNDADIEYKSSMAFKYYDHGLFRNILSMFEQFSFNPTVAYLRGLIEFEGLLSKPDYKMAFEYFNHAIKVGSLIAVYYVAIMYRDGLFVEKDLSKYEYMITTTFKIYKDSILECCPNKITLEMIKILCSKGKKKEAVAICNEVIKGEKDFCGLNIEQGKSSAVMLNQLYSLTQIDYNNLDLFDLLYVLQQPHRVKIVLGGDDYFVESFYSDQRLIVRFGNKFYRNANEFFDKCRIGKFLLQSLMNFVDKIEVIQ